MFGQARRSALAIVAVLFVVAGLALDDGHDSVSTACYIAAVLVALAAVVSAIRVMLRDHVLLLVHAIALFKDDAIVQTPTGRHAAKLMGRKLGPVPDD